MTYVWEGDIKDTNLYLFWKNARYEMYQSAPQCSTNISMCFGESTLKANECNLSNIILDWPENILEMEMNIENDGQLVATVNTGNQSKSNSKQIPFDALVDNVLEETSKMPNLNFQHLLKMLYFGRNHQATTVRSVLERNLHQLWHLHKNLLSMKGVYLTKS